MHIVYVTGRHACKHTHTHTVVVHLEREIYITLTHFHIHTLSKTNVDLFIDARVLYRFGLFHKNKRPKSYPFTILALMTEVEMYLK